MEKIEQFEDGSWFEGLFEKAFEALAPDIETIQADAKPEQMTKKEAQKAFALSTAAGLPPGPIGWLTILPEIMALLKIQVNLIYKIAKFYQREAKVNKKIVLLILGSAMGIAAKHKILAKVGTRIIVKAMSTTAIRNICKRIGLRIGARILQRGLGRWIPIVLAPIFGAFSYSMTKRVGNEANDLLRQDFNFEETTKCINGHEVPIDSRFCNECGVKISEAA
jgi:hypothetical protein